MPRATSSPSLTEQAHHAWAGARDGRRSARRLSHLGAHAWLARREREQAALDAETSRCLDRWTKATEAPRAALVVALGSSSTRGGSAVTVPPSSGMAQVRERRRRESRDAVRQQAEQGRRDRAATATATLDSLIERTAAELQLLQARHTFLFATYTRAFIRAHSRATTAHAPEAEWMFHIARPEAVALTQSVLGLDGGRHAA